MNRGKLTMGLEISVIACPPIPNEILNADVERKKVGNMHMNIMIQADRIIRQYQQCINSVIHYCINQNDNHLSYLELHLYFSTAEFFILISQMMLFNKNTCT